MALTIQNWVRVSVSANEPITLLQDGSYIGGPRLYSYYSQEDTQAEIAASGYFNAGVANDGVSRDLTTGDIIISESPTDGTVVFLMVTNTDGVVTTAAFGTGTVGTANIQDAAVTTAKLAAASVTLAKLAAGITPSHVIKFGGQTTTASGVSGSTHVLAIAGAVAATDRAFVQIVVDGTNNVTAIQAAVTTDTLTVTFSGAPGADVTYNYQLIRAAS